MKKLFAFIIGLSGLMSFSEKEENSFINKLFSNFENKVLNQERDFAKFKEAVNLIQNQCRERNTAKAAYYLIFAAEIKMPLALQVCAYVLAEYKEVCPETEYELIDGCFLALKKGILHNQPKLLSGLALAVRNFINSKGGYPFTQAELRQVKDSHEKDLEEQNKIITMPLKYSITQKNKTKKARSRDRNSNESSEKSTDSSSRPSKRKKRA